MEGSEEQLLSVWALSISIEMRKKKKESYMVLLTLSPTIHFWCSKEDQSIVIAAIIRVARKLVEIKKKKTTCFIQKNVHYEQESRIKIYVVLYIKEISFLGSHKKSGFSWSQVGI